MKNEKKVIPDAFFDEDAFLYDEDSVEKNAVGVLGVNASYEQRFKYSLCEVIRSKILEKGLINLETGNTSEVTAEEVRSLIGLRIDHFSIIRLLKITEALVGLGKFQKGLESFINSINEN